MRLLAVLLFASIASAGDAIPLDLQLDYAIAQQAVQTLQPQWQKAQADYGQALGKLQEFCKAHGDKIPGADPANSKRSACVDAPKEKK